MDTAVSIDQRHDLRYTLTLTPSEQEQVMIHMARASYFWNTMVRYFQKPTEEYFREPNTHESAAKYVDAVTELFTILVNDPERLRPGEQQARMMNEYRKLPFEVLRYRLEDFLNASMRAKNRFKEDPTVRPSIPARKNRRSNKSIKFSRESLTLTEGRVVVNITPRIELSIPGFSPEQVKGFDCLSLSARPRPNRLFAAKHDDRFEEDYDFRATFSKDSS